jgi:organic radical activating enzyme
LDPDLERSLKEGKVLPVMEEFYSLQGEGFHAGKPAYFLRIGGCDVGCHWCDVRESWDASRFPPVDVSGIILRADQFPAKAVVVTGGEPLLYNLDPLCWGLRERKIALHLETSGSETLSGEWDWICLSPKKEAPPLPEIVALADELKVVVEDFSDFDRAEEIAEKIRPGCLLYLQPEWSIRDSIVPLIVKYIQSHPKWRISLQSHKYIGIP